MAKLTSFIALFFLVTGSTPGLATSPPKTVTADPTTNSTGKTTGKTVCKDGQCSLSHGQATKKTKTSMPASAAIARSITWHHDLRVASELARKEGKQLFVNVSAKWCHYCTKMKQETYSDAAAITVINRDFISVNVDADVNPELIRQLGVRSLPTIAVITPEMKVKSKQAGFKTSKQLREFLSKLRPINKRVAKPKTKSRRVERTDHPVKTVQRETRTVFR